MVTVCGCEQSRPIAALPEDTIGFFDHGNAGPIEVTRRQHNAVLLGNYFEPIVQSADHDRADRGQACGIAACGSPSFETALDRLSYGDGLGQRKTDRRVYVYASKSGLLDRLDARGCSGNLYLDVRCQPMEVQS